MRYNAMNRVQGIDVYAEVEEPALGVAV